MLRFFLLTVYTIKNANFNHWCCIIVMPLSQVFILQKKEVFNLFAFYINNPFTASTESWGDPACTMVLRTPEHQPGYLSAPAGSTLFYMPAELNSLHATQQFPSQTHAIISGFLNHRGMKYRVLGRGGGQQAATAADCR